MKNENGKKTPPSKELARRAGPGSMRFDGSLDGMARMMKSGDAKLPEARAQLIELLRGEPDMEIFVDCADKMRRRANNYPSLDDIAARCQLNRSVAFGIMARVLHRFQFDVVKTVVGSIAMARVGEVTEALCDAASTPEGVFDRRLFMEAANVIAQRGASPVVVNNNNNATASSFSSARSQAHGGLPDFEEGVKRMAVAIRSAPSDPTER